MTTLSEAWEWYQATCQLIRLLGRLGEKHWSDLPWGGPLGRDHVLAGVEQEYVATAAARARSPLDDVAVIVLFSVFEAAVRQHVLDDIRSEADSVRHPALKHAVHEARDAIELGSFFRILEPYKAVGHTELIEEVNQVRRYRNWVAHGRRAKRPDKVEPEAAYDRLSRFLALILPPLAAALAPP